MTSKKSAFQSIESSIQARSRTDKKFSKSDLLLLLLLSIFPFLACIPRLILINRSNNYVKRKKTYFVGLIGYLERVAQEKGQYDALHAQISKLERTFKEDFWKKNKPIDLVFSCLMMFVTLGCWSLVLLYRTNKAWYNLQSAEQRLYEEINPILLSLGLIKYPITFEVEAKKRDFTLYFTLSLLTGAVEPIWEYQICTDPDELYPAFHAAEDEVWRAIASYEEEQQATGEQGTSED